MNFMTVRTLFSTLLLLGLAFAPAVSAAEPTFTARQQERVTPTVRAVSAVAPAVVNITSTLVERRSAREITPFDFFFDMPGRDLRGESIGSGIIIDGKLFRGSSGFAGESGHTILTPGQGIACGCGNQGCVQSYASGGMIVRHIRQWIDAGEQTLMVQLAGAPEKIDARHLEMAARAGDAMALRALDQMALYLGVWVFNLYITLNINCFVFGGGLVNMGELLFGRVRQVFDSYCHTEEPVEFLFAQCGQEAGLLGALELLF